VVGVKYKILLVVIPLSTVSLIFLTMMSVGFSKAGITKVASEFLGYKINQIIMKANTEVDNLKNSEYKDDPTFQDEVKKSVQYYAASINKADIESFIAIDSRGTVQLSTDSFYPAGSQIDFFNQIKSSDTNWISFKSAGTNKVGYYKYYTEWDYYFLVSVYSSIFYNDSNKIFQNSLLIFIISVLVMIVTLFYFVTIIMKPLNEIVVAMNDIIKLNDLSKRVEVKYNDEIGEMGFTFNNMLEELSNAHNTIKEYAFKTVLSQKKEERIKLMFQKYVPQDVVNEIVQNPDQALIGKNANLTVLFSDIRSFTTISESMTPEKLVESLNRYFTNMVNIIYKRKGVIDKYIGDAIMAIFGAPKHYDDDVQQAVLAGIEMMDSLEIFNAEQRRLGTKEFNIGIGINYGPVTVGNIGTSQKMDYTVIGDAVNLASRLEGLTKEYHTPIIISEGTYEAVKDYFYIREIDRVRVKGKFKPVKIYEPARKLTAVQKKAWTTYNQGVRLFLEKRWDESEKCFIRSLDELGGNDFLSTKYLEDIKIFRASPPDDDWDGTTTMTHK